MYNEVWGWEMRRKQIYCKDGDQRWANFLMRVSKKHEDLEDE